MDDTVGSLLAAFSAALWVAFAVGLILQAIVCGLLAANLADKKGYSSWSWFAAGLFLGILGLIAAAGLPMRPQAQEFGPAVPTRKCPDCAEDIRREALVCKYCGHEFSKEQVIADLGATLSRGGLEERLQAIRTLGHLGDKSAVPHLLSALADEISDPSLDREASKWLKGFGDATMIPHLESILERAGPGGRATQWEEAVGLLAGLGEPAIPPLIGALENKAVRTSAAFALKVMGAPAIPHLKRVIGEGDRAVRKIAETTLKAIENR